MNRGIGMLAIMAGLFGEDAWPKRKPIIIDGEDREDYELHEEYEKIQRKESKLSRSERDRIVYRYERRQEELSAARREIQEPTMSTTAHIAYSDAIITALRNDPGLSRTDAIYQTIPDYLTWKWSHRVGALRGDSHGGGNAPEGAYLQDHELDRGATPQWALDEYDALDAKEQEEVRERAENAELERR